MATAQQKKGIHLTVIIIVAFIAAVIGYFTYDHYKKMPGIHELNATVLQQPRPLQPFQLTTGDGHQFTNQNLQGHWSMLYFGYTHCPDICPTTLATLSQMVNQLVKNKQTPPQVIFISVDPARDNPKDLQEYASYFNPNFIGATGTVEQITALTKQLGISYQIANPPNGQPKTNDTYLVDHSGAVLLIDPKGNLYAIFTKPTDPVNIANEFAIIKASA